MIGRKLSYHHATSPLPLLNDTIGGSLDKASALWPDRDAVVVCAKLTVDRLSSTAAVVNKTRFIASSNPVELRRHRYR